MEEVRLGWGNEHLWRWIPLGYETWTWRVQMGEWRILQRHVWEWREEGVWRDVLGRRQYLSGSMGHRDPRWSRHHDLLEWNEESRLIQRQRPRRVTNKARDYRSGCRYVRRAHAWGIHARAKGIYQHDESERGQSRVLEKVLRCKSRRSLSSKHTTWDARNSKCTLG